MNGEGIFRKQGVPCISPYHVYLMPYLGTEVIGTWSSNFASGMRKPMNLGLNQVFRNGSGNDLDEYKYSIYIGPGTYAIRTWHYMDAFQGFLNIFIDNILLGVKDLYADPSMANQFFENFFMLDSFGLHDIRIMVNGKNPLNTSIEFTVNYAFIEIERTG